MTATPAVTLKVGSQLLTNWKKISVKRGIEQLAGKFELTATDRWAIAGATLPASPGQLAQVAIGGVTVVTGFLDEANPEYDTQDHTLDIVGRDLSGDLVDCSAVFDGQSFTNRRLDQIAADLCQPFNIKVTINGSPGDVFPLQAACGGESVYEVLSRAAAMRGYIVVSNGNGGIQITQAGTGRADTPLILGQNIIKRGRGLNSHANRFYEYQVIGQGMESLVASGAEQSAQQPIAKAYDNNIRKQRVLRVVAGDAVTASEAQTLANWISSNRAARGVRGQWMVKGWLDTTAPWMPNTQVFVNDPFMRMKGWYLITEVESTLDEKEGQVSWITVTPTAAYVPQPVFNFDGISYVQSQAAQP